MRIYVYNMYTVCSDIHRSHILQTQEWSDRKRGLTTCRKMFLNIWNVPMNFSLVLHFPFYYRHFMSVKYEMSIAPFFYVLWSILDHYHIYHSSPSRFVKQTDKYYMVRGVKWEGEEGRVNELCKDGTFNLQLWMGLSPDWIILLLALDVGEKLLEHNVGLKPMRHFERKPLCKSVVVGWCCDMIETPLVHVGKQIPISALDAFWGI